MKFFLISLRNNSNYNYAFKHNYHFLILLINHYFPPYKNEALEENIKENFNFFNEYKEIKSSF